MARLNSARPGSGNQTAIDLFLWALVGGTVLLAMFVVGQTIAITVELATPLPYLDQWDLLRELSSGGASHWDTWWSQHEEHRPVVPRVFLYADFWYFGGSNTSNYAEILLFHGAAVTVLAVAAYRIGRARSDWPMFCSAFVGTAVALTCSIVQVENYIHAFQVLAMVGFFAAIASFAAILAAAGRTPVGQGTLVAGAIMLAAVSQYSFANGMLVWPVLLALAWAIGLPRPGMVAIALAGLALSAAHFLSYESVAGRGPFDAFSHPIRLAVFAMRALGSPFIPVFGTTVSTIAGLVGLLGFLAIALAEGPWRPGSMRPSRLFLYGVMLFGILTVAAVAYGRSPLGLFWAEAPRYAQAPLFFWAALFVVVSDRLVPDQRSVVHTMSAASTGFALAFIVAITPDEAVPPWRELFGRFDRVEDALYTGVLDRDALAFVFPYGRTEELPSLVGYLEFHRYAGFHGERSYVGRKLDQVSARRSDRCLGSFDASLPVKNLGVPGGMVVGWAWDPETLRRPDRILIVDSAGTIIGQASESSERVDVRLALELETADVGWLGYALATDAPVQAVALLEDGDACVLDGANAVTAEVLAAP